MDPRPGTPIGWSRTGGSLAPDLRSSQNRLLALKDNLRLPRRAAIVLKPGPALGRWCCARDWVLRPSA